MEVNYLNYHVTKLTVIWPKGYKDYVLCSPVSIVSIESESESAILDKDVELTVPSLLSSKQLANTNLIRSFSSKFESFQAQQVCS